MFLSAKTLLLRKQQLSNPAAIDGLAASLQRELHDALDVGVPDGKSRLTRQAGRCIQCTVLLIFDPRSPHAHTCPTCGTVYTDQVHHEWWLMNGHLWTAEHCTRAAALAFLLDDARAAARADDILATYAARYLSWPNRDNALGPTRPFFSTYLESIWLLHLATALDLRIAAAGRTLPQHADAIDRMVEPSAALIASFDEGRSNRQVWHAAALLAASKLLSNSGMKEHAAASLVTLLRTGLHSDGSWYEGENYHLFAHRGLLSGVTLAEQSGIELPTELVRRFESGFAAPFRTMLPDGTFPARRDSQYGVALRQYRTADWAECGLARRDTPELRAALASLYANWPAEGETYRWSSTADAERNHPGVRLKRSDCSWRALLLARIDLPALTDATPHSELLEGQGLAVFRRDAGKFWVGLDYGDPGAGHGHPDRLNLVIATQDARWLDDVGTGSYTSPTLSWYRSSMSHNAPMVNGRDQGEAPGTLLAYDEQTEAGWVSAEFVDPESRVRFVRTVVVMVDHVLDELTWTAESPATVDLPLQAQLRGSGKLNWQPFVPGTDQDSALSDVVAAPVSESRLTLRGLPSPVEGKGDGALCDFECALFSRDPALLWRAATIGPPAGHTSGLVALRQTGTNGSSVRVFAAPGAIASTFVQADAVHIVSSDSSTYLHQRTNAGWRTTRTREGCSESIELGGLRAIVPAHTAMVDEKPAQSTAAHIPVSGDAPDSFTISATMLGEANYRPTEEFWLEAGAPTATVGFKVAPRDSRLRFYATVWLTRPPFFAPPRSENPLDNELADVNSDGVQLHWRSFVTGEWNSVLAVPDGDRVRLTVTGGTADGMSASWHQDTIGRSYTIWFEWPWPGLGTLIAYDCIINECPPDRERRRGQLVLSGAKGQYAYLRGARQSPDYALHVVFDPAQS